MVHLPTEMEGDPTDAEGDALGRIKKARVKPNPESSFNYLVSSVRKLLKNSKIKYILIY